jgi:hypothetical protein
MKRIFDLSGLGMGVVTGQRTIVTPSLHPEGKTGARNDRS